MFVALSAIRSKYLPMNVRRIARRDVPRVLDHVAEELAEERVGERVGLVVARDHRASEVGVAAHERVERLADHLLRDHREPRKVDERLEQRLPIQLDRPLADVDRQIPDPLEIRRRLS